jgi:eukaryotic-like serine/threonine-protein kinase
MRAGQQIGPFVVDRELGSGAMGSVFRARHTGTSEFVAIKIVAPGLSSNSTIMARFQREAAILKQLRHRNIVRLVATGKFQGTPFYAMEYVDGESLDHVIERRGRLTWEEVVEFGQQLCAALQHAHEAGIIHRDLKPSNVMIVPDGTVKLTDFGIAKDMDRTQLTAAQCTVGTAAYMSPEQFKGERDLTAKSDLYNMGVMFYELLTGNKPFNADNAMDMFMQHLTGTFERPSRRVLDIPIWLDNLVCQLLEKSPDKRPVNAEMVGRALSHVKERVLTLQSAGVEAARTRNVDRPPGQRLEEEDKDAARTLLGRKKRKKKKVPFYQRRWAQAFVLSALLVGIVFVIWRALQPPSPDQLYARAAAFDDPERRDTAQDAMKEFLERYPGDPRAAQVRTWARNLEAREQENDLLHRANVRRNLNKDFEPASVQEGIAYDALRFQRVGDLPAAYERYQRLKEETQNKPDDHGLLALAESRVDELGPKVHPAKTAKEKGAERTKQKELLKTNLKEIGKLAEAKKIIQARALASDIAELYGTLPELDKEVDVARKLQALLAKGKFDPKILEDYEAKAKLQS